VLAGLAGDGDASPNDRLIRLLFFLAACRENGAARVTAVVPYLAYARKDRQTKRRDPVTMRYVAQLFEAVGTNRVVALDVHNVAPSRTPSAARRCISRRGSSSPRACRRWRPGARSASSRPTAAA
jgi:hypothetical protein